MLFDPNGNRKYLTSVEATAFRRAARNEEAEAETFCLALAYSGARISEVLALTPAKVDIGSSVLVFESLKKRKRGVFRAVPVPQRALQRLDDVYNIHAAIHDNERRHQRIWPWSRTTAWHCVKTVMLDSGIPAFVCMPKALRHTFGVQGTAEVGIPLNIMQRWLGHARIETTAIYTNVVGAEERSLADRMWRKPRGRVL